MSAHQPPNIVLLGIDSLLATHLSCYGYPKQTTPHIDHFAEGGALFERTYSPHIPTTSAYASMLTGMDSFGTQVVALRHQGPLRSEVLTAAEIFRDFGYDTSCVGFTGNPSSRGFDRYFDYPAWDCPPEGRMHKAHDLNKVAVPELERMAGNDQPFFIEENNPDYIVMGTDWQQKDYFKQLAVSQEFLDRIGAKIIFMPYTSSISTSKIIDRIKLGSALPPKY